MKKPACINILVKKVQKYFPSRIFEGLIAIESIDKILNLSKRLNTIKAKTVIKIKIVLMLKFEKKPLFSSKLVL